MQRLDGSRVRPATAADAAACAAIYAPYVTDTAISFEAEPPSAEEMADRIVSASVNHAWLVLEEAGVVVGYAYGLPFRDRAAYRWTCEVSVYMQMGRRRTGGGRALYEALLARLAERGYHLAVAGMTLSNEASVGLHRALGFEPVGTYREVGFKHGRWHDVAWVQRILGPASGYPRGERPKEKPMPHTVRKQGSKYAIVDKNTGKVKGKSDTKKKAKASARIRDQRAND